MTDKDLAKMILIYRFIASTNEPTRIVQDAKRKLQVAFSKMYTYKEETYLRIKDISDKAYTQAWKDVFGGDKNKGADVSLGIIIVNIWHSVEKQNLIGSKVMQRAIDSYFGVKEQAGQTEAEINSNKIADRFRELVGDSLMSPLARRKIILEQNMILEKGYRK